MKVVSESWKHDMLVKMSDKTPLDVTTSFPKAAQWLIERLASRDIPFTVYNLGAGVRRITTVTDKCPCCKRSLT